MSESFGFASPWVLWGLLAVPLWAWARSRRLRATVAFPPLQHRTSRVGKGRGRRRWLARALVPLEALLVVAALVGIAGPVRETTLELLEDEGVDVVLVLDISLSMLAEDFPPTRLTALQEIARDFITRSDSNRVGVVVFALDAYVQTPLTTDHFSLLELLDGVTVYAIDQAKSGGTAIGDALLVAARQLESAKIEGRDQAVVLITDGESNAGIDATLAARYVRQTGARFYAIGIGGEEPVEVSFEGRPVGPEGSPYVAVLDDRQLRAMAEAAEGRYYRATDVGVLEEIFAELARLESAPLKTRTVVTRHPLARRYSLVVFFLFVGALRLGGVVLRRPYK